MREKENYTYLVVNDKYNAAARGVSRPNAGHTFVQTNKRIQSKDVTKCSIKQRYEIVNWIRRLVEPNTS